MRDDRDLSQIYQRDPDAPDPVAECDTFDGDAEADQPERAQPR